MCISLLHDRPGVDLMPCGVAVSMSKNAATQTKALSSTYFDVLQAATGSLRPDDPRADS
jgi:hypothetical protein